MTRFKQFGKYCVEFWMKKHHAGSLSGSKNHFIIARLWRLDFLFFCYIKALSGIPVTWPDPADLWPSCHLLSCCLCCIKLGDSRCGCSSKAFGDGLVSTQLRCTLSSLLVVFLPVLHPHMAGSTVRSVPRHRLCGSISPRATLCTHSLPGQSTQFISKWAPCPFSPFSSPPSLLLPPIFSSFPPSFFNYCFFFSFKKIFFKFLIGG